MTLEGRINELKKPGLERGIDSDFTCKPIAEIIGHGARKYELRRALAPHVPKLMEAAAAYANHRLKFSDDDEDAKLDIACFHNALERYREGGVVTIDGLHFFDAEAAPCTPKDYKMNPFFNSAASGLMFGGFGLLLATLPLIGTQVNAEYISPVHTAMIATGFGMKFLNKAYKEAIDRPSMNMAKNAIAGMGLMSYGVEWVMPLDVLNQMPDAVHYGMLGMSLVAAATMYTRFFKLLFRRERIKEPLPPLEMVREDFAVQAARYLKAKDKYRDAEFIEVKMENFSEHANMLNRYLRYHLHKIKIDRIHFDWDHITGKILGATARADMFVDSAEFSAEKMKGMDLPLFAKVYSHEASHLDGVVNEGRANLRADLMLEDLAVYKPDEGYDLQLELGRVISAGHAYALAMEQSGYVLDGGMLADHLRDFGLHPFPKERQKGLKNQLNKNDPLEAIAGWTFNKRSIMLKLQSIVGGSNPNSGYTIDHYKLLKRAGMI